jgi:hypothetical protein
MVRQRFVAGILPLEPSDGHSLLAATETRP